MHLGETLLVLGALVIFSITTLYLNDTKFDNDRKLMENEFRITAVGIAQSFLEEAQTMQFDEAIINESMEDVPDDFTAVASLGPDGGESYPNFDDFDDFDEWLCRYGCSTNVNAVMSVSGYFGQTSDIAHMRLSRRNQSRRRLRGH